MATIAPVNEPEQNPRVKAVFDDIRQSRNTEFVGNIWRYLAFDPNLLESTWRDVKAIMGTDSLIDSKTKEMLYVAVSTANACGYCIHSHTAAAKSKGMSDAEHAELMQIIAIGDEVTLAVQAVARCV